MILKNFSKMMENSKADYIMFSDHDDVWFNNKIEIKTNHVDYKEIYDKLSEIFNSHMCNNDVIDAMAKYF